MINRREFMVGASGMMLSLVTDEKQQTGLKKDAAQTMTHPNAKVSLVKTTDRAAGVKRSIDLLEINPIKGKEVLLKPNFNSADAFPGSTHNDTLLNLIKHLKVMGAKAITLGERCGPGSTAKVLKEKGIYGICEKENVRIINFEELPDSQWMKVKPVKSHWNDGFDVAKPVIDSECVVSTCCLKTHGYGGVFTMSLKLSVGVTHKRNMSELHTSFRSMRKMIAEINQAYNPSLIVMDAIEAFVDGGPAEGKRKRADLIIAGTDRIAIDAVGLAVLKDLGSNDAVMGKKIFEQEQIARAVEIGLGISRPQEIEFVTDDKAGRVYAERLKGILLKG
ncbi:MAG: DUF362 domain-containing protein [Nitrospirae bacterium]|nr:DUF362 domain-containing protein [Nitrospirota bacterium]